MRLLGQLVNPAGPWTWGQVARDIWSKPRALDTVPSQPGKLVDTAGTRTRPQVTRDIWSNPQALGPGLESSGKAGRHRENSDPGATRPAEWVKTTVPRTRARVIRECFRPHGNYVPGPNLPGQLVDSTGLRSQAGFPWDDWLTPQGFGHGPDSPGRPGRSHGPSETGPSGQRQQVDRAGLQTGARVARDSWSTSRTLGPKHVSPGTAGRPRGPSETGWGRPGQQVDPLGSRVRGRVARDA